VKTINHYILVIFVFFCVHIQAQIPQKALIGYWHNWNMSEAPYIQLNALDSRYNVIDFAFAVPHAGTDYQMEFIPEIISQTTCKNYIVALQNQGKKIIISIGGATAPISLDNINERNTFITTMNAIIDQYGFDGIDIDLEGSSVMVSGGTIANPIDEKINNLIYAIKQIMKDYHTKNNKSLLLTMAPETAFVQGGMSAFGGIWGAYLPVIHALRDSLSLLHVQLYNSGSMYGIDGNIYTSGNADFIVAMTEAVIKGFSTSGGFFTGLPANKIAVGLPACPNAAGSGFVDTATVNKAMKYLLGIGPKPGTYTLVQSGGYPTLRGMMTWSMNWDAVNTCASTYQFAENFEKIYGSNSPLSISCSINPLTLCEKESISIPFTVSGNFLAGNIFTAQLSDNQGSFTNSQSIGSVAGISSGSILCRIPSGISGNGYRIRIVSSSPVYNGNNNGSNISINVLPNPIISGSFTVCQTSGPVVYSVPIVSGHQYEWKQIKKGDIIGGNTNNTLSINWKSPGIDTIRIKQLNPLTGCSKDTSLIIIIQDIPQPYINGQKIVCDQSIHEYSVPIVSGHQYEWKQINKGNIKGGNTNNTLSVQWKSPGIDTIRIKQINPLTGCSKDTNLIITIQDIPQPYINGQNIVCEQSIQEYSVPKVPGHQYEWSEVKNGEITGGNTSNTLSIKWKNSGIDTIRIKQTNLLTGCSKDTDFQVIIHSLPVFTIDGLQSVCQDTVLREYSVKTVEDNEYNWRNSGLGIIKGSSTENRVLLQWKSPGIDTLFFMQKNSKTLCSQDTFIVIKINPQPNPIIMGNTEVFEKSSDIEYRVNFESGSIYEWFLENNNAEFSNKDQNRVKLRFTKNGLVLLKVRQTTKDLCTKESSISIMVNPISSIMDKEEKLCTVFPNPVDNQGELFISCLDNNESEIHIELIDIYGSSHIEEIINPIHTQKAKVLSLGSLSRGMYMLKVRTLDKVHIEKIIVR
jgi:chitinase